MKSSSDGEIVGLLRKGGENSVEVGGSLEPEGDHATTDHSRRRYLAVIGSGLTALAGCSAQTDDVSTSTVSNTNSTSNSSDATQNSSDTEGDSGQDDSIETRFEEVDPGTTFDNIYTSQFPFDEEILTKEEVEENRLKEGRDVIDHIKEIAEPVLEKEEVYGGNFHDALKQVTYQQLGFKTDQAVINRQRTGSDTHYNMLLTNDHGDWMKTLSYALDFLEKGEHEPLTKNEELLSHIWNQDRLDWGSSTGYDTWRQGVEKHDTYTGRIEGGDGEILGALTSLSRLNDNIIVGHENMPKEEWTHFTDYFGDLSFSRDTSNQMRDMQDLDENSRFNPEVELIKGATVYFHGFYDMDDTETFMQISTGDELAEDLENGVAENPYHLVDFDGDEWYASEVTIEKHRENIWNSQVPDSQFPEHEYPGNVSLPPRVKGDDEF